MKVKNTVIIFGGLMILSISLVISSIILSNSFSNQNHIINGSLGVRQSDNSVTQNEYMPIGEISSLLGYDNIDEFTQDVLSNKLGDLPYVNLQGKLIFSRTAFEEWLVDSAKQKK